MHIVQYIIVNVKLLRCYQFTYYIATVEYIQYRLTSMPAPVSSTIVIYTPLSSLASVHA